MGWFSNDAPARDDVSGREVQEILCAFIRDNANKIADDVQRRGPGAVRALADHLEAGNIRRSR